MRRRVRKGIAARREGGEHIRLIGIVAELGLEGWGGDGLGDNAEIVTVRDGAERGENAHKELAHVRGFRRQGEAVVRVLTWYHFGGSAMAAVQN